MEQVPKVKVAFERTTIKAEIFRLGKPNRFNPVLAQGKTFRYTFMPDVKIKPLNGKLKVVKQLNKKTFMVLLDDSSYPVKVKVNYFRKLVEIDLHGKEVLQQSPFGTYTVKNHYGMTCDPDFLQELERSIIESVATTLLYGN